MPKSKAPLCSCRAELFGLDGCKFTFLLIPKQDGIHTGDQQIHFIDFPKFITVGILPEYGVAGIKDRSHADDFQGMGIPKNAEIVQMPVGIGQNLIFQEEGNVCFVIQKPILVCATAYSRWLCSKKTIHMTPIVLLG